MRRCSVPLCKSVLRDGKRDPNISFHEFPSDLALLEKWITIIGRKDPSTGEYWSPLGHSVVCSLHFTPDCFRTNTRHRCLKPGSVPSIFPNDQSFKPYSTIHPAVHQALEESCAHRASCSPTEEYYSSETGMLELDCNLKLLSDAADHTSASRLQHSVPNLSQSALAGSITEQKSPKSPAVPPPVLSVRTRSQARKALQSCASMSMSEMHLEEAQLQPSSSAPNFSQSCVASHAQVECVSSQSSVAEPLTLQEGVSILPALDQSQPKPLVSESAAPQTMVPQPSVSKQLVASHFSARPNILSRKVKYQPPFPHDLSEDLSQPRVSHAVLAPQASDSKSFVAKTIAVEHTGTQTYTFQPVLLTQASQTCTVHPLLLPKASQTYTVRPRLHPKTSQTWLSQANLSLRSLSKAFCQPPMQPHLAVTGKVNKMWSDKCRDLRRKCETSRRHVRRLKTSMEKLREENEELKASNKLLHKRMKIYNIEELENGIRDKERKALFLKDQLASLSGSRVNWSEGNIIYSLHLYHKSPVAYQFLREMKLIGLPSLTTLKQYMGISQSDQPMQL